MSVRSWGLASELKKQSEACGNELHPLSNYAAETLEQDIYKLWESWVPVSKQRLSMTPAEISLFSAIPSGYRKAWAISRTGGDSEPV